MPESMIELTDEERVMLKGLLPRIYAERDRLGGEGAIELDNVGWWIEGVLNGGRGVIPPAKGDA